jgi:hypothetical protein
MPVLPNTEQLERIYLPSTMKDKDGNPVPVDEQAFVVMDISSKKTADLALMDEAMTSGEMTIAVLAGRIREWNYTDSQGATLNINNMTVGYIDQDDFRFLLEKIKGLKIDEAPLTDEEKKTSSSSLTTQTQVNSLE